LLPWTFVLVPLDVGFCKQWQLLCLFPVSYTLHKELFPPPTCLIIPCSFNAAHRFVKT
jgi:hypothetical protein